MGKGHRWAMHKRNANGQKKIVGKYLASLVINKYTLKSNTVSSMKSVKLPTLGLPLMVKACPAHYGPFHHLCPSSRKGTLRQGATSPLHSHDRK